MGCQEVIEKLQLTRKQCTDCGACIPRCEVLSAEGGHSVGYFAGLFSEALIDADPECVNTGNGPHGHADPVCLSIENALSEQDKEIFAVRRCCMCGYCTQVCPEKIDARSVFANLRELFALSGITGECGFEATQIDKEWHIFSVYRAVYGIGYADLPHLGQAQEVGADTLFFPGCTLASYAPELTREVFSYLSDQGISAVISEECCGSPLKSAGFGQRARTFKEKMADQIQNDGIERIICVCPGCQKELKSASPEMEKVEFLPLPELLHSKGVSISNTKGKVAVFDSCYDREGLYGNPLRKLLPEEDLCELPHHGCNTLCCGAGGAVSLVDPDLSTRRAARILEEAATTTPLLVSNCPTCAYTFAFRARQHQDPNTPANQVASCHYLDMIFENSFDWDTIFDQLEGMWSGEYGAWVVQQLT